MRTMRLCFAMGVSAVILPIASGCAVVAARLNAFWEYKAERCAVAEDMAMRDLEAAKAELDADTRALQAEHEYELALLQADAEKRACNVRSQLDESVRTKLGLDFDQRMHVGQMQVDMNELRSLLEQRERDYADKMHQYTRAQSQYTAAQTAPQMSSQVGPSCQCLIPDCAVPTPGCAEPADCCCKKCGKEVRPQLAGDCAGTRPFREPPTKPQREPITAMQIPLVVPVRLELGVTNSHIDQSQIRRLPYMAPPPTRPQVGPNPCGQCPSCRCGQPCQNCAPAAPNGAKPPMIPPADDAPDVPQSKADGNMTQPKAAPSGSLTSRSLRDIFRPLPTLASAEKTTTSRAGIGGK